VTAKRIVAVLAAVALIVIALVVRRTVLDDDATTSAGTTPTTAAHATAGELVCITELAAACHAIEPQFPDLVVRVEPAGTTLDALATADNSAVPMWATIQPFPAMVDALRTEPLGFTTTALGASRLTVATPKGPRAAALVSGCAGVALWACIGRHAGAPWTELGGDASLRTVRPAPGAVDREAVALASFAEAVAGYFGTPQISAGTWGNDPAFGPWVRRLSRAVDVSSLSAGTPLATMLTRTGSLDIAATTDAEVSALGGDRVDLNYPEPSMWVEAVLAVPGGQAAPDSLAAALTDALASTGWSAPGSAAQRLPDAGTMLALRTYWRDAAG
jgi:hypothetical protein